MLNSVDGLEDISQGIDNKIGYAVNLMDRGIFILEAKLRASK